MQNTQYTIGFDFYVDAFDNTMFCFWEKVYLLELIFMSALSGDVGNGFARYRAVVALPHRLKPPFSEKAVLRIPEKLYF